MPLAPPKPKRPRLNAIIVGAIAAALLIFAAFSKQWLGNPSTDIGFGPMGCTDCCNSMVTLVQDTHCGMSNSAFVEMVRAADPDRADEMTSGAFAPMGWVTFGLCLLAGLALLAAAGLAYRNKRSALPVRVAWLSLVGALITGMVFVATKPGGPGFVGVAMGFWAFSAGTVGGIVAARLLAKRHAP